MDQVIIGAISLGASYSLLTTGFVLVLNATGAVNLAHGALVVTGGIFAASLGTALGVPAIVLLPVVVVAMMGIGCLLAVVAYYPFKDRSITVVFISTISIGIILENALLMVFGPSPRVGPVLFTNGTFDTERGSISIQTLSVIAVAAILIGGQYALFNKTRLGKRLRAVAQDREMALALGMNVTLMIILTFGIAAALAGAAGLLFANTFYVSPGDGESYIIKTYVAVALGGWGSLRGAVLGAFIVAASEVIIPAIPLILPAFTSHLPMADQLFSSTSSTICLYLMFLAVLFVRPQGLFGEAIQQRA